MKLTHHGATGLIALSLAAGMCGCAGREHPQALEPRAFAQEQGGIASEPMSPVDQPGVVGPGLRLRSGEPPQPEVMGVPNGGGASPKSQSSGAIEPLSPAVVEQVRSPAEPASAPAASSTRTASTTSAQADAQPFLTVGGLVAEANGTPIYADRVLTPLEPALAAQAREMDREQFRAYATSEISKKILDFINVELEYAAAQRYLTPEEKKIADMMTERWRQQQITVAGGSLELARRKFAERGEDFDERVVEQQRIFMSQLFYQKRVVPRIQVTAQDMRRYYERNLATEFTVADRAKFRMIKIEPAKVGDAKVAMNRIQDLRKRAAAGEDFAALAELSTDPILARNGGQLPTAGGDGFINKGAFALEKVEEAVWALQPGEVTPVIDAGGAFYIAKLEQKEKGRTLPFEAEQTQETIRRKLESRQFAQMRGEILENLNRNAIVRGDPRRDPQMMRPAIDIAMQRYPAWHRGERPTASADTR
jgi:parvulin-like peptidyl-prolyl isomerase